MASMLIASPVFDGEGNQPPSVVNRSDEFQQGLASSWWTEDDFFDDRNDVIAVFDFDYPQMASFETKRSYMVEVFYWTSMMPFIGWLYFMSLPFPNDPWVPQPEEQALSMTILSLIILVLLYVIFVLPCITFRRMKWAAECHHLAITRDGILHVQDKHKQGWGLPMCDKGKQSRTILLDHVTDCIIKEPAGNSCCCVRNVLYEVIVQSLSSPQIDPNTLGWTSNSLVLTGLRDPYKFQELIFVLKRSSRNDGTTMSEVVSNPFQKPAESVEVAASLIELV